LPAGLAWSLGLGIGLLGFTVTFDVAMGFAFAGGRAAFFGAAALRVAVFGAALPGRLAALFGFFEGIWIFPPPNERARDYTDAFTPVQGARATYFSILSL
ncbi:MAG: hypothetical protein ACLPV8_02585, partial [Steroidobacteraceae bacterium]